MGLFSILISKQHKFDKKQVMIDFMLSMLCAKNGGMAKINFSDILDFLYCHHKRS